MKKITYKKLYKALSKYNVNVAYLKEAKIKKQTLSKMLALYSDLFFLLDNTQYVKTKRDRIALVKVIENIEYDLQECWGFKKDTAYHSYWNHPTDCTCPRLDNEELFGTNRRNINSDCPFHNLEELRDEETYFGNTHNIL
jgi:hypothetical protein